MVLACASMLFSTNSAIAFRGLLCERAMMRIAFQSSPIRSLPLSLALAFMPVLRPYSRSPSKEKAIPLLAESLHSWPDHSRDPRKDNRATLRQRIPGALALAVTDEP